MVIMPPRPRLKWAGYNLQVETQHPMKPNSSFCCGYNNSSSRGVVEGSLYFNAVGPLKAGLSEKGTKGL